MLLCWANELIRAETFSLEVPALVSTLQLLQLLLEHYFTTDEDHPGRRRYHPYQHLDGNKVRQRTLLDISRLPMEKILALKAALQGKALVDWDSLDGVEAKDFGLPYEQGILKR